MIVLALTSDRTAWWASLAVGLFVALVVWGLLEALRRTVNEVDRSVSEVWTMGKRVAGNTQTTYLLNTTVERGGDLLEELGHHQTPPERSEP